MRDITNYSLLGNNTFGIDARCTRFIEYSTVAEAVETARLLRGAAMPFIIIGGGSNLLLTRDFDGVVVRSAIKGMTVDGERMRCGSGEVWDDVVDAAISHGLYGGENLSLIPGDVGASAVQNIGAYGVEVKDLIESVEAVRISDGELCLFDASEMNYAYRDSRFKHDLKGLFLITSVTYRFSKTFVPKLDYGNIRTELQRLGIERPTARQLRDVIIGIRKDKLPDPEVLGNAGSFFMNPVVTREKFLQLQADYPDMPHYFIDEDHEKIPAGWMIDQCGWKGRAVGRAAVHSKQALVLVNLGGATGQEIVKLCNMIRADVAGRFGIDIRPEVNII